MLVPGPFYGLSCIAIGTLIALILLCFPTQSQAQESGASTGQAISFTEQIKPILDNKCILCHACYDAPCQLNLTSSVGADRGSSKVQVYNPQRLSPVPPTRLYIDAQTAKQWRGKGFFSVLKGSNGGAALMSRMIDLGHHHRFAPNEKIPSNIKLGFDREDVCAKPDEFDSYAKDRPFQGMPMGTTGLTPDEYKTLKAWIDHGAPTDQVPAAPNPAELEMISVWEKFLNGKDGRTVLVARYLYEHLFLAHLYFDKWQGGNFFELVRSHTPPGEPIKPVATVRPNDAVDGPFYYRLGAYQGTIVRKTHITYDFGKAKFQRIQDLFLGTDWEVKKLPGYTYEFASNPFSTFEDIPARIRYQYLLDDAEYFIRTFIRGPVCRGEVATNVIRDQFWVVFQTPESDQFVTDAKYRRSVMPLLGLPGHDDQLTAIISATSHYQEMRDNYVMKRQKQYATAKPQGPSLADIWNGGGTNRGAMLTVFRHFNNTSVVPGFIGDYPETLWVLDFPLLERSYYELVVNFNVFGNISEQLQTRLYFDLIRRGAELNYLRFLPAGRREALRESWYQGLAQVEFHLTYMTGNLTTPTAIKYTTSDPNKEFPEKLLSLFADISGPPDIINRCEGQECWTPNWREFGSEKTIAALRGLSVSAARDHEKLSYKILLPELTLLRIDREIGFPLFYSIARNRYHKNVAFVLAELQTLVPQKDTVTIYPEILGSYPNLTFRVKEHEIDKFANALLQVRSSEQFEAVVDKWGIRRTHPDFWQVIASFLTHMKRTAPIQAGVLDVNRYGNQ